jgi:hypothetical protein
MPGAPAPTDVPIAHRRGAPANADLPGLAQVKSASTDTARRTW